MSGPIPECSTESQNPGSMPRGRGRTGSSWTSIAPQAWEANLIVDYIRRLSGERLGSYLAACHGDLTMAMRLALEPDDFEEMVAALLKVDPEGITGQPKRGP